MAASEPARAKIGIALGAGGAKGVAHIPMLEALDELGITPHRIAGCSIGAVIGAMYASGLSAAGIKARVRELVVRKGSGLREAFLERKILRWMEMIDPRFRTSGLVKSEAVMAALCEERSCSTFEELRIPLMVVATDFREGREVVFDSGPLEPAIHASMALPGLFAPVEHEGRVLIDGGTANPVPYDLLFDACDIVIAVDINSGSASEEAVPGYFATMFGAIQIMQRSITEQKLRQRPPDIYIRPALRAFRTLHFLKAEQIYDEAQTAKQELKRRLADRLAGVGVTPRG
jgi:NTE family protein